MNKGIKAIALCLDQKTATELKQYHDTASKSELHVRLVSD